MYKRYHSILAKANFKIGDVTFETIDGQLIQLPVRFGMVWHDSTKLKSKHIVTVGIDGDSKKESIIDVDVWPTKTELAKYRLDIKKLDRDRDIACRDIAKKHH